MCGETDCRIHMQGMQNTLTKTVQFILALAAFMMINNYFGLFEPITKPIVAVALAVIFTFLPMVAVVLAIAFLIVIHMCTVSMGVAGVSAAIFLLMFIFYVRFSPKTAIVILLNDTVNHFENSICDTDYLWIDRCTGICDTDCVWNHFLFHGRIREKFSGDH